MLRENLEQLKNKLDKLASTHAIVRDPPASQKNKGIAGTYLDPRFNRNTGGWPPGAVPDSKVRPFLYEVPDQNYKRYSTNNQNLFVENFIRSSQDLLTRFKISNGKGNYSSPLSTKEKNDAQRLKTLLEAHQEARKKHIENEKALRTSEYVTDFVLLLISLGISFDLGKQIQKYIELNYGNFSLNLNPDQTKAFIAQLESVIPLFIHPSGPICLQPSTPVYATFLGPSGAGKTTVVLKLALQYRNQLRKKVGIISWTSPTSSSYQYGKIQAELQQIPFTAVSNGKEFLQALDEQKTQNLVLIDTFSSSLDNPEQKEDLQLTLVNQYEGSKFLVLPAYGNSLDGKQLMDLYKPLQVDSLIFTKTDESASHAILINSFYELGLPVSYLSTGSDIFVNLAVADPEHIAKEWIKLHKDSLINLFKNHEK
jgi:flagellar biosynthesis GTPase FlhF